MAIIQCDLRIIATSRLFFDSAETWATVKADEQVARIGIIQPGMIDVVAAKAGTDTKLYAWQTASTISGYKRLRTASSGILSFASGVLDDSSPPTTVDIDTFATQRDDLEGKQSRNSTTTFSMEVRHDDVDEDRDMFVDVTIFHRTAGGTETQIGSYSEAIGMLAANTWHTLTESVTLNATWLEDERLVVKYEFRDEGIPP